MFILLFINFIFSFLMSNNPLFFLSLFEPILKLHLSININIKNKNNSFSSFIFLKLANFKIFVYDNLIFSKAKPKLIN